MPTETNTATEYATISAIKEMFEATSTYRSIQAAIDADWFAQPRAPLRPSPAEYITMQNPSVGRIVHYHDSTAADPQAAIIIAVHDNATTAKRWPNVDGYHLVSLTVFAADRQAPYSIEPVPYSEEAKAGHWTYPPRV